MNDAFPSVPHSMRLRATLTLAALLLTACASPTLATQTPDGGATILAPTATISETAPPSAEPSVAPTSALTETAATPFATSRGDELEATDPDTVTLASGGPQVVEFFAFW